MIGLPRRRPVRVSEESMTTKLAALVPVLLLLLLSASGCATPGGAVPQIAVSPEAAARSCIIHICGTPPADLSGVTSRPDAPAYVRAVAGQGEDAANAADVELGNPEIRVLVRARVGVPLELLSLGDAEPYGHVTPTAPRVVIGALLGADGTERGLTTDRVTMFPAEDGSATLTVFGHDAANAQVHATTTLKLARGDRAVLVSTTIENTGPTPMDAADMQDHVTWASMRAFVPGSTRASGLVDARDFTGPYVAAVGERDSVAFTSTEGEVLATLDKTSARIHLSRTLVLAPRSQKSFDRVMVVGTRADSSSVVAELLRASGIPTGAVRVSVFSREDEGGTGANPATAVTAAHPQELIVRAGGADALTVRMPSATFDVELPEGTFTIRSKGQPEGAGVAVTIHAGLVANISVPLAR